MTMLQVMAPMILLPMVPGIATAKKIATTTMPMTIARMMNMNTMTTTMYTTIRIRRKLLTR